MSDLDEPWVRNEGTDEIVVPAPCAITAFIGGFTAAGDTTVDPRLVVGWNAEGSPIVMGDDGGLRLLEPDEHVRDTSWEGDSR